MSRFKDVSFSVYAPEAQDVFLVGDFNDWWPFSRVERALARAMGSAPRPRSFPSAFPLLALDRIWIRPRRLLVDLRVGDTPLTRQASDHLPLVARLRMPARPDSSSGSNLLVVEDP